MSKSKFKGIDYNIIIDNEVKHVEHESRGSILGGTASTESYEMNTWKEKINRILDYLKHLRKRYGDSKSENLFDIYQQKKLINKLNTIIRNHINKDISYEFFARLLLKLLKHNIFDLKKLLEIRGSPLQNYVDSCDLFDTKNKEIVNQHLSFINMLVEYDNKIKYTDNIELCDFLTHTLGV
jgi:hypothetical protein